MAANKDPVTAAIRALRAHAVDYRSHRFDYEPHGGAEQGARVLGVELHSLVKTLVLEDDQKSPFVVLMHGDREVSLKQMARLKGCKAVRMCDPTVATRHSGYAVGGTSPFGLRKPLPIYVERSILALPVLYINGGKRGFLLEISPTDLLRVIETQAVDVATD